MSLGELTGANLRAYYHLEDVNDSSGNSINLTNLGSVAFNQGGLYKNSADFGSTGAAKALYYTSNPFSTTTPDAVFLAFWFTLNDAVNSNSGNGFFFDIRSVIGTTGRHYQCYYSISSGNITITARRVTTSGNINISVTTTADLLRNKIEVRYLSSIPLFQLVLLKDDGSQLVAFDNSATAGASLSGFTSYFSIGNSRSLGSTGNVFAKMDEFIIEENGIYTDSGSTIRDRRKYYTQSTQGFCI